MAKILISGGAGFIGSHLTDCLLSQNHQVICVDNLVTGSLLNLEPAKQNPHFKFISHDVCIPFQLDEKADFVLHLASPASPEDYREFPLETLRVGSLGTFNLLDLAYKMGAKFLLASTSEVYGDPKVSPQSENYWGNVNPVGPRSMYDEAKRFAEALTVNYSHVYQTEARIMRIFNTYGPRMRKNDGRVVPNFITQALQGQPLTVYGDGSQTRSFCYISDLVAAIYKVMFSKLDGPINLGNPFELRILDFARLINRLFERREDLILFKSLPQDDPLQRKPDITRARALLGWEPEVALEEGLQKTIHWFKGQP